MIKTYWTLAHNLTKLPVVFDHGYPQAASYNVTMHALGNTYTWNTREEAIEGLAAFERTHPNHPVKVGIMPISIDLGGTVELIDPETVARMQIDSALKKLDKKDADLIRTYLK